jgi:hypothetical protein
MKQASWVHRIVAVAAITMAPLACAIQGAGHFDPAGGGGTSGATAETVGTGTGMGGDGHTDAMSTGTGAPTQPKCPYEGTPIDPSILGPACPTTVCGGGGHCVPNNIISAQDPKQLDKLASCDEKSKCVPDIIIANQNLFIPPTCKSVYGAEGRCISECVPEVKAKVGQLPQSTCQANERCVPCYDPFTQQETGACKLSCDPGPKEPPVTVPKCCSGIGTCVPKSAVPAAQASKLSADSCGGQDLLCAPDMFINNQKPQPCETSNFLLALLGSKYKPGVCLPGCLPDLNSSFIKQDGCPSGMKCAPCYKPGLLGPKKTGACDL